MLSVPPYHFFWQKVNSNPLGTGHKVATTPGRRINLDYWKSFDAPLTYIAKKFRTPFKYK